jgi:anaerobic selenocysteine-containing dehydrogenase
LLSFGADLLSTWVSPVRYARGYGQFRGGRDAKERGAFVHVDSRYSMTAANADQWIPVLPGREGILALSIAYEIISQGRGDPAAAAAMTGGAGAAALDAFKPDDVVRPNSPMYLGIPDSMRGVPAAEVIKKVAIEFSEKRPALAIGGGAAGAHTNGLFTLSAIYSLNFLVGSVGRRPGQGGVVFNPAPPVEGVPAPTVPGSLTDWMGVAQELRDGRTRVLMVHGANPVHGLPDAVGFREAVEVGDPFVVSFSSFLDDTTQLADLVLPERAYLEDWGDDVPEPGPGYQVVGFQQPVVNPLPGLDPRSFPDLLLTLSQGLGLDDGLPTTFRDVLREEAQRLFDLNRGSIRAATFDGFWNELLQRGGWWDAEAVSNARPPAPPNLAQLTAQGVTPVLSTPEGDEAFYLVPFLSNSLLDGRGAHLPWLQATPDPLTTVTWQTWVEINTRRAREMGLEEGDVVRLISTAGDGEIEAIVYLHPAMPPGVVGVPVGQGHAPGLQYATRDGRQRGSNPISILAPQVEPQTGSLAWGATRVLVEPTGRRVPISKFEGLVPAFPIGSKEEDIVQVTRG